MADPVVKEDKKDAPASLTALIEEQQPIEANVSVVDGIEQNVEATEPTVNMEALQQAHDAEDAVGIAQKREEIATLVTPAVEKQPEVTTDSTVPPGDYEIRQTEEVLVDTQPST